MIARCLSYGAALTLLLGSHAALAAERASDSTARQTMTSTPTRAARRQADVSALRQTPTRRLVEWLESVSHAESAMVMRVQIANRVESYEITFGTRIVGSNTVGRPWIARCAKFLRTQLFVDPSRDCGSTPASALQSDQLILRVRFGSGDRSPNAVVRFRDHCVEFREGAVGLGRAGMDPLYGYMLWLAREALPDDEMIRRLFDESSRSQRAPNSPAPNHPQPGEYVYVEELPEAITKVPPTYPDEARSAGIDGKVLVLALAGRDGSVEDVRVQRSIPGLDAAAMACVRQWKFKPATAKGEPVAVWVAVPVRFTLH